MSVIRMTGAICLVVILIAGCRLNEEQQQGNSAVENAPVSNMKPVPYDHFSLQVNYGNGEHNRYEGMYQKNGDNEKAEIEDKLSGIHQEGEEALDEMKMILSELAVNQHMTDQEAIRNVLESFNLDSHYDHLRLNIKLHDGTVREIKK
ncbi:YusW family protein [Bacillus atrophaeus]|uniref:YusW family protein n=1 Tax=Bacillus atrophaeus TaxID=1452 RepID=UPI00228067CF|nr:YusW family protein [Bacillus atrophaeus]MCY8825393.1 YusW family protein [Bacillus atrophaeus]MCY8839765.1 YusW family protein [Bacillus atrophaeus]MCY9160749.1 YusW family protein [Bacillus atrophaeus]MEC0802910.1 YusW family protein [Bacillus atrophaeus]MEC0854896.1 YusW family protein [Bacillus atrophaeus]